MIELRNVSKTYEVYETKKSALKEVSLTIEDGEFVFVVGTSGSGKSTLIKLLLKELDVTSGSIIVDGENITRMKKGKIPLYRRKIGVVFQDFRLLRDRSVYENIAFAQRVVSVPAREIKRNVPAILARVGLAGKYKYNPKQLSGGEQQRVAIARALVNKPQILLADEPTGNLDDENAQAIMKLLEDINREGTTVIMVTHNLELVAAMNKRVITLKRGEIASDERRDVHEN